MKRRFGLMAVSLLAAGSLQIAVAPVASACADPNCPWSPITGFVKEVIEFVDDTCDTSIDPGCPF